MAAVLVGAACQGPALHVVNEGGHRVFVDGVETDEPTLPFRYYGATRWDALPIEPDERGLPRFALSPASGTVRVPPPASPWLFPLDLPVELVVRLLHGRRDATANVELSPRTDATSDREIPTAELGALSGRARTARVAR